MIKREILRALLSCRTYGAQHPGRFLPGTAAAKEAHDGDDGSNTEENVGTKVVVSLLVGSGLEVEITGQDISPGVKVGLSGVSKYHYFSGRKINRGEMFPVEK